MADKIRLLPEVVANQIAAGEVVNRPASVVKEMMENAIDAGARTVKVNFRDGGKDLIQIVDDGSGMSPIDARMAFDRHATSKITSVEDIYALDTFGFRGEALASIAAVAQVELRTRQEGRRSGYPDRDQRRPVRRADSRDDVPWGRSSSCATSFTTCPPAVVSLTRVRLRPHRSRPNSSVLRCAIPISPSNFTPTTPRSYALCHVAGGTHRRRGGASHQAEPAGGRGRHFDRLHRGIYRPSGCRQAAQRRAVPLRQRTLFSKVRTSRAPS